jgi:hypothetical protein
MKRLAWLARSMLALGLSALAGGAPASEQDVARLAAFRLDKPTLTKFETALNNLAAAVEKQPSLADREEDRNDDDDEPESGGQPSLAEIAASYNRSAPLKKAIESAGMTAESFSLVLMAWVQAAMAYSLSQSLPPLKRAEAIADTGVPPANVAFVQAHKEALTRVGARLKAIRNAR